MSEKSCLMCRSYAVCKMRESFEALAFKYGAFLHDSKNIATDMIRAWLADHCRQVISYPDAEKPRE